MKHCRVANVAFTLIELLVAISVIVILVALILPASSKMAENGNTGVCLGNQKNIVSGLILYAGEHDGQLPDYADLATGSATSMWWYAISPYISSDGTDKKRLGAEFLRCPSAKGAKKGQLTYGVNYGPYGYAPFNYRAPSEDGRYSGSKKLSQIPTQTFLLADHFDKAAGSAIYHPSIWSTTVDSDKDGVVDSSGSFLPDYPYNHAAMRHRQSGVFSFPDGSSRIITAKEWAETKTNGSLLWGKR